MNNHEWARYYVKLGWYVLPCEPGQKRPLAKFVPNGVRDATNSIELVDAWWGAVPTANVAIATGPSQLHVIDVDTAGQNGQTKNGLAVLAELEQEHGQPLPRVVYQHTGGGGLQVFCEGMGLGNYRLAKDIDTRGAGGYVLVSPSLHPSGNYYLWAEDGTPSPKRLPPPLPEWTAEMLKSKAMGNGTAAKPATAVPLSPSEQIRPEELKGFLSPKMMQLLMTDGAEVGDRSDADFAMACALVRRGLSDSQIGDVFNRYPIGQGKVAARGEDYLYRTIAAARAQGQTITPYVIHQNGNGQQSNGKLAPRPATFSASGSGQPPEWGDAEDALTANVQIDESGNAEEVLTINVQHPKTKDYWNAFRKLDYEFKLNDLDSQIEVNGRPISDYDEAEIRNKVRDIGLTAGRVADALTHIAAEQKYHPIKDYLTALVWDGHDHLGEFLSHLEERPVLDPAGRRIHILKFAFLRWMIGSCAKIFEQEQNFMLVWDSGQGAGKSTLARWLCPRDAYFMEGGFNPDSNDDKYLLCTRWFWEVAELQGTSSRANREALKDFITKKWLTVRLPYGKRAITKPTLCSLIGTINDDGSGLLNDPTGNRRFVIVPLKRIDYGYQNCNRDQLWAQVMHLYRSGEPWRLTAEEEAAQKLINAEYETESYLEGLLWQTFVVDPAAPILSSVDILTKLEDAGLKGSQQLNLKELARVMTKAGIEKGRGREREADDRKRPTGYKGVRPRRVEDEEIPI